MNPARLDTFGIEDNRAGYGSNATDQTFQERGFARPIVTEDADVSSRLEQNRDIPDGDERAIGRTQALDGEDRRRHISPRNRER